MLKNPDLPQIERIEKFQKLKDEIQRDWQKLLDEQKQMSNYIQKHQLGINDDRFYRGLPEKIQWREKNQDLDKEFNSPYQMNLSAMTIKEIYKKKTDEVERKLETQLFQ